MKNVASLAAVKDVNDPRHLGLIADLQQRVTAQPEQSWCEVTVTTPSTPGQEFLVKCNLSRTPRGFYIIDKTAAVDVWRGPSGFAKDRLYLISSATNQTITLRVIA